MTKYTHEELGELYRRAEGAEFRLLDLVVSMLLPCGDGDRARIKRVYDDTALCKALCHLRECKLVKIKVEISKFGYVKVVKRPVPPLCTCPTGTWNVTGYHLFGCPAGRWA